MRSRARATPHSTARYGGTSYQSRYQEGKVTQVLPLLASFCTSHGRSQISSSPPCRPFCRPSASQTALKRRPLTSAESSNLGTLQNKADQAVALRKAPSV